MDKKIAEQMMEMTKSALDSMLRLQEINDRTVQSLAKKQLETVSNCMQNGVKRIKATGDAKDAQSAVSSQADLASELGLLMIDHAKETMDILNKSKKDLSDLMENNLKKFLDMSKVQAG